MNKKHIVLCLVMLLLVNLLLPTTNVQAKAKKQPTLNKSKITLSVGKSYQLKVKYNKKKVKWSTSNKKIAKVNKKGKITAIKKGSCKIYAKFSGKKLICKVKIKKASSTSSSTSENRNTNSANTKATESSQNQTKTTESSTKKNTSTTEKKTTEADSKTEKPTTPSKPSSHTHSYTKYIYRQPTCSLPGLYGYKCSCGSSYVDWNTLIPQVDHVYESTPYYTKPNTCTEWGYDLYHCTTCKGTVGEKVKKVMHGEGSTPGHDYQVTSDVISDGCTIETVVKTCSRCGDTIDSKDTFSAPKHDYQLINHVDPHCSNNGYNEYKCSRCGVTSREIVPTSKLYHNDVAIVNSRFWCSSSKADVISYTGRSDVEIHLYEESSVNTTSTRSPMIVYYCKDCHTILETAYTDNGGHWSDWRDREYHFTETEILNIINTTPNVNK